MNTDLSPADLDGGALDAVTDLETRIGAPVVAYRDSSPYARLDDEQLAQLQATEQRLGLQLLAYQD
ncbi:hypothetical protein [Pseudonocardia endophytica]|uniref:Uncharacterized protein n=1 Tax=Pseudonocardia endophytica TaxID=401976 RepID=A0A4V2PHM6_PSEEN|nr:hypothetical protein [Pseudonocardia endophytica]TCK21336.1 hypothetical protein EV378_5317 [Pseudonocardia endophytica]